MSLTMLTYVSTLLASAVCTIHAFLRALPVMDLSVILFIACVLVRVTMVSNTATVAFAVPVTFIVAIAVAVPIAFIIVVVIIVVD